LKECVADLFCRGLPLILNEFPDNDSAVKDINQAKVARNIYRNAANVLCLYITKRSDGFDPSISTKSTLLSKYQGNH
jgi:hypothetical protein